MKKHLSSLQKRSLVLALLVLLTLSLGSALGKYVYRDTAATISLNVKAQETVNDPAYDLFYPDDLPQTNNAILRNSGTGFDVK